MKRLRLLSSHRLDLALPSAVCVLVLGGASFAQTTERVSISSTGTQGDAQTSGPLGVSSDGRYVAFCSNATNLVPGGTNGFEQIYVRDRQSGTTELVSVSAAAVQGNNASTEPTISEDGRYVAFTSNASNLVAGDVNFAGDVFVRDRATGTTEIVSGPWTGIGNDGGALAALSADGRYVAFVSGATGLVPGDTNNGPDIFVRDRLNGTTERVSVDSGGAQGIGFGFYTAPSISLDGRYVGFSSTFTNLVPGDANDFVDAFVHDRQTGATERVSVSSSGAEGNQKSGYGGVVLSADGRFAAFNGHASNLVPGDTNGRVDVFVRDRLNGTTERVNLGPLGTQANNASASFRVSISDDGRYVTYDSQANNIYPGTSGLSDVYRRDRQTGTTVLVSVNSNGMPVSGHSNLASISGDGRFVAFHSSSATLVPGDTNAVSDTFIHDCSVVWSVSFCFGDGTGTACPCGNNTQVGDWRGCQSAQGVGAQLTSSGVPSLASDTLVLNGTGQPMGTLGLYFQGTAQAAGGAGILFGDGLLCVAGTIVRLGVKAAPLSSSSYPEAGDPTVSVKGLVVSAPSVRTYQLWYRDSVPFCSASTFNLTNGLQVEWQP